MKPQTMNPQALAGRANRVLLGLRDQLTPGQRWTAALVMIVVLAVVLFGLPTAVKVVPGRPVGDSTRAAAVAPSAGATPSPTLGTQAGRVAFTRPATLAEALGAVPGEGAGRDESAAAPEGADRVVDPPSALVTALPSVVALVRAGNGLPNRDDAAMARAFLDRGGFDAEVVTYDRGRPTSTLCDEVAAKGDIVIMSTGPDAELRRCLIDRDLRLIAFDEAGDQPPGVVSTRRGIRDSLVDLGAWGADDALQGKVGLVAGTDIGADAKVAAAAWRERGVDLAAIAFVGDAPAEVPDAVRRFAEAGVEVVVFAVPVETQRRWLVHEAALGLDAQHVVSDVFDGIIDESYPVSFDGARAHTSLRVPWFAREKGETPQQATCRQTWEGAATRMLPSEMVAVYAWCQHVALAGAALVAVGDGGTTVAAALRQLVLASPLTSDLGPLPDGGFGPTQDAELTWRASCRCWQSTREFRDRAA